MANSQRG